MGYKDKAIKEITDWLARQGLAMIQKAQASKEVDNVTYNQKDAFAALVYYGGKLQRRVVLNPESSKRPHKGWAKYGIPEGTGREWLETFIDGFKAPAKGFALVVVNVAFYTAILENKHNYKIISQTFADLDEIKAEVEAEGAKAETTYLG